MMSTLSAVQRVETAERSVYIRLSDGIMASYAYKMGYGEDYPPKNCAYTMREHLHPSPMTAFAGIFV